VDLDKGMKMEGWKLGPIQESQGVSENSVEAIFDLL
jgi:hypothetical protein